MSDGPRLPRGATGAPATPARRCRPARPCGRRRSRSSAAPRRDRRPGKRCSARSNPASSACGASRRVSGWRAPPPCRTDSSPAGRPASSSASARRQAAIGVCSDGFSTTALPAASAGPTLWTTVFSGALNGVIAHTTPSSMRRGKPMRPDWPGVPSIGTNSPPKRRASSADSRSVITARRTSLPASCRVNPASAAKTSSSSLARRSKDGGRAIQDRSAAVPVERARAERCLRLRHRAAHLVAREAARAPTAAASTCPAPRCCRSLLPAPTSSSRQERKLPAVTPAPGPSPARQPSSSTESVQSSR